MTRWGLVTVFVLLARVASAQITFAADKATVQVGESYTLYVQTNANEVHVVKLDGVSFFTIADCTMTTTPIICTKSVSRTGMSAGVVTHVLTSIYADGTPRPPVTVTVTVTDAAASLWMPQTTLTSASPIYAYHAADGSNVVACTGDGEVYCRTSADEGASFGPWQDLGSDMLYLERPISVRGADGLVAAVGVTGSILDFYGQRAVGEVTVRRLVAGVFQARQVLTSGAKAYRVSTAIDGANRYVTWMDYRHGVWCIFLARSTDAGVTWQAPVEIAHGTNSVGAGRPTISAVNGIVLLAWMDDRDGKAACTIEGGTYLPVCTEVYLARSVDGGATFGPSVRLTFSATTYAGRPDIAQRGETALIAFDSRVAGDFNDIGLLRSFDGGASWSAPETWARANDQTHGTLSAGPGGFGMASMSAQTGTYQIWFRQSADGVTWTPDEQVSVSGGNSAPAISQTFSFFGVSWQVNGLNYRRRTLTPIGDVPPPANPCVSSPLVVSASITAPGHTVTWPAFLATDERGCTAQVVP